MISPDKKKLFQADHGRHTVMDESLTAHAFLEGI